jgi:hypothetical protein
VIMKSFYFTHQNGKCVKIVDIPVLQKADPLSFQLQMRLQLFVSKIQNHHKPRQQYSFRDYLRSCLKWNDYSKVYEVNTLEQNA